MDKNLCLCGCGTEVKVNNKFIRGHNGKLNKDWIQLGHNKCKGVPIPEERKQKISKTLKGHIVTLETLEKMSNSMKKLYSSGKLIHWAKDLPKELNPSTGSKRPKVSRMFSGEGNPFSNKKHTQEARKKQSLIHGGTGIPYENAEYPFEFTPKLKEEIRKRDNYTCKNCGMTEEEHLIVYGCNLTIHHIDYNKNNCKEDNLISLCRSCHLRTNYNRNYWKEIFLKSYKINNG